MAVFKFDEMDKYVQEENSKFNFLKLQDDGWYARVRFMYGPGETFEGHTVHNVGDSKRPRYVVCLREPSDSLDACPLCANGTKTTAQFFMPVYVQSIVKNIRGIETEEPVGQVMLFQRGTTFTGSIKSVIRQAAANNKSIVNCTFNLVRNGKAGSTDTNYSVELIATDDVSLEQLPPRPQILGSYILPKLSYDEMVEKYINGGATTTVAQPQQATPVSAIQPRTISASTFAGNSVVGTANNGMVQPNTFAQPMNNFNQPMNTNQAPVQAPQIGSGATPF